VLAELHGMVRAWVDAGCPGVDDVHRQAGEEPPEERLRLGSFERWAECVDAILRMHGMDQLGADHAAFMEDGSEDIEEERRLLAHWEEVHGDAQLPSAYVAAMAYALGVPEHFWRGQRIDEVEVRHGRVPTNVAMSFGKTYLRTLLGRRTPGGRVVTKCRPSKGGTMYYLE
jgi:hypothetical protein